MNNELRRAIKFLNLWIQEADNEYAKYLLRRARRGLLLSNGKRARMVYE